MTVGYKKFHITFSILRDCIRLNMSGREQLINIGILVERIVVAGLKLVCKGMLTEITTIRSMN